MNYNITLTEAIPWIAGFSLLMFIWEHVAINNGLTFKPTYFIDLVTKVSRKLWRLAGVIAAYVGTMYYYMHLDKIGQTFLSFAFAVGRLVRSCTYFMYGFDSIALLYNNPATIYAGAGITAVLIAIIACRMFI